MKHGGAGRNQGRTVADEPRTVKKQISWTKPEWFAVEQAALSQGEKITDYQREIILRSIRLLTDTSDDIEIFTDDNTRKIYGLYDGAAFIFNTDQWSVTGHVPTNKTMRKLSKLTWCGLYQNFHRFLGLDDQIGWQMVHTVISPEAHDYMTERILNGEDASKILDRAIKSLVRAENA